MNWDVRHVAETESTNADLAAAARDGAPAGTVIVAERQTAGRGRLDRTWETPPGSGLTMSALLRPAGLPPQLWPWIPLAAGVAAAGGVGAFGLEPQLKWPNDVELDGFKVAGILVERVETQSGPAAVIGIGLNVAMTEAQLPVPTATSLHLNGVDVDALDVLERVLEALDWSCGLLHTDPQALRLAYTALCGTIGSDVRVSLPDGSTLVGRATDVDEDGRLVVDGIPITAGDVVRVRA